MATLKTLPPREDASARWAWVENAEAALAPFASALGVVFVLVVIGENLSEAGSALRNVFLVAGWLIWCAFVAEFALRAYVSPSRSEFVRRNWWQGIFLILPFLRFISVLRIARLARAGRIVGSAVRGTRSAGAVLRDRLTWLAMVHVIVVLAASQLLFEFGDHSATYGATLHAVALASVAGEPLGFESPLAQVLEVVLALYAVIVFATAAATLGAFFLQRPGNGARMR